MSWLSEAVGSLTGTSEAKKAGQQNRKDVAKRLKLAREAVSTDNLMDMTKLLFPGLFAGTGGMGLTLAGSGGSGASSNAPGVGNTRGITPSVQHASRLPFTPSMVASDGGVDYASPNDPANFGRGGGYNPFPTFGSTEGAVTKEFRETQQGFNPDYRLPTQQGESPTKEKSKQSSKNPFFGAEQGLDEFKPGFGSWVTGQRQHLGMWQQDHPIWNFLIKAGLTGLGGAGLTGIYNALDKRAEGGPVEAGSPAIVGEEGPELMVPEGGSPANANMGQEGMQGEMPPLDENTLGLIIMLLMQMLQGQGGGQGMEAGMPGMESGMPSGMPPEGLPMAPESAMPSGGAPLPPMEPRALGGAVARNKPYLVGEQGPEVLIPKQSGTIVPNGATQTQQAISGATGAGAGIGTATPSTGGTQPVTGQSTPAPYTDPGSAIVARMLEFLNNPGQTSTIGYQRGQAQANRTEQRMMNMAGSSAATGGINPNSPIAQALKMAAVGKGGELRAQAAGDQAQLEETLRRSDITTGANMYEQAFNQLMKYMGLQVSAITGTPVAQVTPTQGTDWASIIGDLLTAMG